MSIASDVAAILRVPALTGVVAGKTTRVYTGAVPQRLPDNTIVNPPFVTVTLLNTDHFNTIDKIGNAATGTRQANLDVDCVGATDEEAETIKQKAAELLDDYTGNVGGSVIQAVDLEDSSDDFELPEHGEGLPRFTKTLEVDVIHRNL